METTRTEKQALTDAQLLNNKIDDILNEFLIDRFYDSVEKYHEGNEDFIPLDNELEPKLKIKWITEYLKDHTNEHTIFDESDLADAIRLAYYDGKTDGAKETKKLYMPFLKIGGV